MPKFVLWTLTRNGWKPTEILSTKLVPFYPEKQKILPIGEAPKP